MHIAELVLGWLCLSAFVVVAIVNGTVMLVSPRRWFDLPGWLAPKGQMRREGNTTGFGALRVRVLGAITLGFVLWVCSGLLQ